jgi:DNA (cytosine-5)-methyltransferase 1
LLSCEEASRTCQVAQIVLCVERSLIADPGVETDKPAASETEDESIQRSKDPRYYFRVTAERLKYAARKKQQAYTFGDAFYGAGGMSRAAVDAGLRLKWAFDNDNQATGAYRLNFDKLGMQTYCLSHHDFMSLPDPEGELMVDFLHLSPPCPPWSVAQATKGKGPTDEMVKEALHSTKPILEKVRPRIVTFETVPGLLDIRYAETIDTVVDSFTSLGYSIRWKIVHFAELSLPQLRQRLFVIASQ